MRAAHDKLKHFQLLMNENTLPQLMVLLYPL